jgi:hypothetical protein
MNLINNLSNKQNIFVDSKHVKNFFDVVYFTDFKLNLCMTLAFNIVVNIACRLYFKRKSYLWLDFI